MKLFKPDMANLEFEFRIKMGISKLVLNTYVFGVCDHIHSILDGVSSPIIDDYVDSN